MSFMETWSISDNETKENVIKKTQDYNIDYRLLIILWFIILYYSSNTGSITISI